MYGYGIHTGTSKDSDDNRIVKLQGRRLVDDGPLETLKEGFPLDETATPEDWTALANEMIDEIEGRSIYPLGVDAPLTLAESDNGRPFEALVRTPYRTPETFDPWPKKRSSMLLVTRLWTEMAYIMVKERDWTLWVGEGHTLGTKLLVEAYPRLSWATLAACRGAAVLKHYGRSVQVRDDTLAALRLKFVNRDRPTKELRDAAVCAVTIGKVATRTSGYLGKELEHAGGAPAFGGGGIAVPWLR